MSEMPTFDDFLFFARGLYKNLLVIIASIFINATTDYKQAITPVSVSYTHLTLPTILRV